MSLHSELQTRDILVAAAVEEGPRDAPPTTPATGAAYIVGSTPSGAWAGKPQCVASYTSGGWRFVAPVDGLAVHVKAIGTTASFHSGGWDLGTVRAAKLTVEGKQVVGSRRPAIADASGGSTVDAQARLALSQILLALRQHGLIEP